MIKFIWFSAASIFCSLSLAACSPGITLEYSPKTTAELRGQVDVNTFTYLKAHASDDNELGCNKIRCVHLTETVSDYVTNAVKREFRQAGISLKNSQCSLAGEVNELSVSPGFFGVTYKSDIRYILNDGAEKTLFDNDYTVEFDAAGTIDATLITNNLNKALADNIGKLLDDSGFVSSIGKHCR